MGMAELVGREPPSYTCRDRSRLLVPVEQVVQDLNWFLRGWSGYFRYGNSAREFNKINHYAMDRLARFIGKRHKRGWGYG